MKMNKKLEVENWDGDSKFELSPRPAGSGLHRVSVGCLELFQGLKEKISVELSFRFGGVRQELLRQALNEAAALAASTTFPTLFLPVLAEEKVFIASEWERKQRSIQDRSWLLAA
jgi:hypothetical protein